MKLEDKTNFTKRILCNKMVCKTFIFLNGMIGIGKIDEREVSEREIEGKNQASLA